MGLNELYYLLASLWIVYNFCKEFRTETKSQKNKTAAQNKKHANRNSNKHK
jgi:hypothetical protein